MEFFLYEFSNFLKGKLNYLIILIKQKINIKLLEFSLLINKQLKNFFLSLVKK